MTVFYHDSSCSTLHIKTRALQSRPPFPFLADIHKNYFSRYQW
ncbi:hypothetical protein GPC19245_43940 (plasmid) [Enterobacter asburiae]|nr:hypothetical protein EAS1808013_p11250 [Enterobacter asburiae]